MHPDNFQNDGLSNDHWTIYARERISIVFMSESGEIAKIPINILDIIVNRKIFDGGIYDFDEYILYMRAENTLAKVPKTLAMELAGSNGFLQQRSREME